MRLILITLPAAVALGFLARGRLSRLADVPIRWWPAAVAGVGLQLLPLGGMPGFALLLCSFALLLVFAGANLRHPGFALILLGLALNATVIAVNQGMPVTREALSASGQASTIDDLRTAGGAKHHLATREDHLLWLADVITLGPPIRQAISVGDIATHAGVLWFVVWGMRRRTSDPREPTFGDPTPDAVQENAGR